MKFLVAAALLPLAACVEPLVNVTTHQYIGQPLANGITRWLGIRYAAPPLGNLRFAPPQDPPYDPEPKQADKVRETVRDATPGLPKMAVDKRLPAATEWKDLP